MPFLGMSYSSFSVNLKLFLPAYNFSFKVWGSFKVCGSIDNRE